MNAGTCDCWYLRHRLASRVGSAYLVVAVLSTAAYLVDRHEYSIALFVLVCASFPVHWVLYGVFRPQMAAVERLPYGELIGVALLIALTTILYFGTVHVLACAITCARRWLARADQSHD
jgi:hypothetical protein